MASRLLASFLACGLLAAPAAADRLLVAGPDGFVMQADTADGVFEYFACQCSGPIRALAADDERLYTADSIGRVSVFDVHTGALQTVHTPCLGPINAMAAADGALFIGTEIGWVMRLDPLTGAWEGGRPAPTPVRALLAHAGFLLVGGTDGIVYRAPLAEGEFTAFTGRFCISSIRSIVTVAGAYVFVDDFGIAVRVSGEGRIRGAFWVPPSSAFAVSDGALLLYYDGGNIPRADWRFGTPLPGGFQSPIAVEAMLVIDEPLPLKENLFVRGSPQRP